MDHVDVLIVGAGLSGVGAACHLAREVPGKTYAIMESRAAIGGTWDLFRYPGVRSDSDMFTMGYAFRPWQGTRSLAAGGDILRYVRETAREYGVESRIRYRHTVIGAEWSTEDARWTVRSVRADTGETVETSCSFLFLNCGYYRYDAGFTPRFAGAERFAGRIVHPQHWPADLDHAGRRVIVIGSGATAVTLVPALAATAEHVTMLQRSPTYVISLPGTDPVRQMLRRVLPDRAVFPVVRWKNIGLTGLSYRLSRRRPELMKRLIRRGAIRALPRDYDVDTHFAPRYDPWDERLCVVPDGDLFRVIRDGRASVVTDRIETFTRTGIRLESGTEIPADVVVTATGLNVLPLGGVALTVDGRRIDLSDEFAYKGMMLSGVPNLAFTIGYTNASWTLKADLVAGYVCRLLRYMDRHGYATVTPGRPPSSTPTRPLIDLQSGYVRRSVAEMPKQGVRAPWRLFQSYPRDLLLLRLGRLTDGGTTFTRPGDRARFRRASRDRAAA